MTTTILHRNGSVLYIGVNCGRCGTKRSRSPLDEERHLEETRFDIVFKKLQEETDDDFRSIAAFSEELAPEADEIEELRKLSISIDEPTLQSHTIT